MGKLSWAVSFLGHAGLITGLALVAASGRAPPVPQVSLMIRDEQPLDAEPEFEVVLRPPDSVAEPRETPESDEPDPPPIEAPPVECIDRVAWPTTAGRGLTMRLRKPLRDPRRKHAAVASHPTAAPARPLTRAVKSAPAGPTRAARAIHGGAGILYPPAARQRGLEGVVLLSLELSATGKVTAVTVLTSSGHPILDAAACRAAWKWRFAPALLRGQPQKATLTRQVRFRLR